MDANLGTDLQVVLGPPGLAAHDAAGLDLLVVARPAQRPSGIAATTAQGDRPEPGTGQVRALATVAGRENLAQALILRLLTPRGSLAALGHATYGSRLHELVGRNRTSTTRARCRAFVLQALADEPRVDDDAVELTFDPESEGPSELRLHLAVRPRPRGDTHVGLELVVGL